MGRSAVVALLALVGLLCAAGMGYGVYVVSRGSVAVPVTRLQPAPQELTPARVRARPTVGANRNGAATTTTTQATGTATTTVDDHGGRRGGSSGSGSGGGDNSGHGGGGHGGDD